MRQIVAALDLGTSKSIAFVARKDYLDKLSVLRTESLPSKNAIRRGRVYNSDETSEIISKLIGKLNSSPDLQVEKIYVGIGGQSLHTRLFNPKKVIENGIVSPELLDSFKKEALHYKPELDENFGVVSCEYYADGQLVLKPKGTVASVIEARFLLMVGNPCLKRNLEKLFKEKGISVAGYFISPLATAEAALTPKEKELGCALVEFGEGVTYVSVYKNDALKHLVTLPLGGLAITKDIRSLNVLEDEAEALKIKYGKAVLDPNDKGAVSVNEEQTSSRRIELNELNGIIEARVDEIVKNVWNQIQMSGYSQALDAGIVITGGGALLRDLPQFIRNQTGKEVRLASAKVWDNQVETQLSPAHSCVVGLAILGKDNCGKEEVKEVKDKTKIPPSKPGKQPKYEPETTQDETTDIPTDTQQGGILGMFRKVVNKGKKIVDTGMEDLFDNYDSGSTQSDDKDAAVIQHKDKNFDNNKNRQ